MRSMFLVLVGGCAAEVNGVPVRAGPLEDWLDAGSYLDWEAEPEVHPSTGPHFGGVRTFMDPLLAESLEAGASLHPEGAASVKELYGDGDAVLGEAVMVKVQDAEGGDSWYWFERFEGEVLADARGLGVCVDCHSAGADHVLTPWPPE